MQRRKWDAKTNAMIVIEGLKGKPVAELCAEPQISQAQYDQWRDQCLAHAPNAFEVHAQSQREARRVRENARLKARVGELTLELKKATRCSDEPPAVLPDRPAQRSPLGTHSSASGGAPVLGLPPHLGLPALRRSAAG
jgi:hypothetical protein